MTTSNKLARSRVKTPFRLKWNGLVFHELFINIKESSESWRDSFLDHVWDVEVRAGYAGKSMMCWTGNMCYYEYSS